MHPSKVFSRSKSYGLVVCLVISILNIFSLHLKRDLRESSQYLHEVQRRADVDLHRSSLVQAKNKSTTFIPNVLKVSALERFLTRPIISPHNFNTVIEPVGLCNVTDIKYLIYVHSAVGNEEKREMIRYTWASVTIRQKYKIALMFVMGVVNNSTIMDAIEVESVVYGDLLVEDFMDSYRNMTHKAMAALKWTSQNCHQARHIIKTDDDIVLDIHTLLRDMNTTKFREHGQEKLIMCHDNSNAPVERGTHIKWPDLKENITVENGTQIKQPALKENGPVENGTQIKWPVVKEDYATNRYPTYCSGAAYILSKDVVQLLYEASLRTKVFWIDDVYITGILRVYLGLNIRPLEYILGYKIPMWKLLLPRKKPKYIIFHNIRINDGYRIWNALNIWNSLNKRM